MRRVVAPVLLTWDVDPSPRVRVVHKQEALRKTTDLLTGLGIPATFFCVATVAQRLQEEVAQLVQAGQEIACHGLTHGDEEEYNRMPADLQRRYLRAATEMLSELSGAPIRSFRGPRVKTSHVTQQVLEELGYIADSSVSSQRLDLVSSNLINPGWVFAPRRPYRPSHRSAFAQGERNLWVVPISALGLPFISSVLNVFGLRFMQTFFKVLYRESLRTGKPIVYLVHPFEFAPEASRDVSWKQMSLRQVRTHGLTIRSRFYVEDVEQRFALNQALFSYMGAFPHVQFMTVGDYASRLP